MFYLAYTHNQDVCSKAAHGATFAAECRSFKSEETLYAYIIFWAPSLQSWMIIK